MDEALCVNCTEKTSSIFILRLRAWRLTVYLFICSCCVLFCCSDFVVSSLLYMAKRSVSWWQKAKPSLIHSCFAFIYNNSADTASCVCVMVCVYICVYPAYVHTRGDCLQHTNTTKFLAFLPPVSADCQLRSI